MNGYNLNSFNLIRVHGTLKFPSEPTSLQMLLVYLRGQAIYYSECVILNHFLSLFKRVEKFVRVVKAMRNVIPSINIQSLDIRWHMHLIFCYSFVPVLDSGQT